MSYEYLVVEFLVDEQHPDERLGHYPDMERIYFPAWLNHKTVENAVARAGGHLWAAWYGGMFGLATNRFIVVSVGPSVLSQSDLIQALAPKGMTLSVVDYQSLVPTVRPLNHTPITRFGFFVFRWLRLAPGSIDEWTGLCNETWPNFQQRSRSECLAVWQVERDDHLADEILMCTWYEDLHAWEHSREVDPADAPKWRRRAELEYNHWGIGARRME
jgi:hypothetical protein